MKPLTPVIWILILYYIVWPSVRFFVRFWIRWFFFFVKTSLLIFLIFFVIGAITEHWAKHHRRIIFVACFPLCIFSTRTTFSGLYHIIAFMSGHLDDEIKTPGTFQWVVRSCALPASVLLWLVLDRWSLTNRERCDELVYEKLPRKLTRLRVKVVAEEQRNRTAAESISKTVAAHLTTATREAQIQHLELTRRNTIDCTQLHGSLIQLVKHLGCLENVFNTSLKAVQKLSEEASTFSHSSVNEAHQLISREIETLKAQTEKQEMEIHSGQAKLRACIQEELEAKERAANLATIKAKALSSINRSSVFLTIACWPIGLTSYLVRSTYHEIKYDSLQKTYSAQVETACIKQQEQGQSVAALETLMRSLQLERQEVDKVRKDSGDLRDQCQDIINKLQASRMFYSEMVFRCLSAASDIESSKLVATRPRTIQKMQEAFKELLGNLALTERDRVALLEEIEGRGSRKGIAERA